MMPGWYRYFFQARFGLFIAPGYHENSQGDINGQDRTIDFFDRTDAEAASQLQNYGALLCNAQLPSTLDSIFGLAKSGVNRNSGYSST